MNGFLSKMETPLINITELNERYSEALAVLNEQLILDEGHSNAMDIQALTARMRRWLQHDYRCYGIIRSSLPIAYALYRDDGDCFYLRQLFTARAYRNQGLASQLLEYLQLRVFLNKPVRLEVLVDNKRAVDFYHTHGFKVYSHTMVMG